MDYEWEDRIALHRSRVALTRQYLSHHTAMMRASLTPVEYVAWRLGVSVELAERYIQEVREGE